MIPLDNNNNNNDDYNKVTSPEQKLKQTWMEEEESE